MFIDKPMTAARSAAGNEIRCPGRVESDGPFRRDLRYDQENRPAQLMEAVCTSDRTDETISVVIELRFSPEELADIDQAAQFEGLDRTTFLQRLAIPGVRDALRMSDILQSLEGEGGDNPIFRWPPPERKRR